MNRKESKDYVMTKRLSVRMKEAEYRHFLRIAAEKHMTVSDLIREALYTQTQNVGQKN